MRITFSIVVALALAVACSQRVTPEEEFARQDRERPIVSAEGASLPPVAGAPAPRGMSGAAPTAAPEDAAQTIRGTIEAPAGASGGVLFLFVRAAGATGGPPLAVQRIPSPSFPREFSIGPQDAMMAGGPFPDRVSVEARLDQDGNAMTEGPGDLSASSETAPGSTGITLTLAPGA
ncbi:MAG TPA: hypothetical protein VEY33_08755 [Gemmatimonadota bacterium]|nr:hypothetical protein [Gemmatimonadota bacterium]